MQRLKGLSHQFVQLRDSSLSCGSAATIAVGLSLGKGGEPVVPCKTCFSSEAAPLGQGRRVTTHRSVQVEPFDLGLTQQGLIRITDV